MVVDELRPWIRDPVCDVLREEHPLVHNLDLFLEEEQWSLWEGEDVKDNEFIQPFCLRPRVLFIGIWSSYVTAK